MRNPVYSIKDIVEMANKRIAKKFDFNIAISGARGNGKSTLAFKILSRFPQFNPRKHIVYRRKDVMELLEKNKYGTIMDDEAIRTGYKRYFYEQDQKSLIQMLNMYRDNFNVYVMAIPNFYSLDKGVRDLIKIHIQVVKRGLGVIHISQPSLYTDDAWNVNYNKKIEDRWSKTKLKNPNFNPPYRRLSTFYGFIKFNDMTPAQRKLYESIKVKKRKEVYDEELSLDAKKEENKYDGILNIVLEGGVTKDMLMKYCLMNGLKYHYVVTRLNQLLNDRGIKETLGEIIIKSPDSIHSSLKVKKGLPISNKPMIC